MIQQLSECHKRFLKIAWLLQNVAKDGIIVLSPTHPQPQQLLISNTLLRTFYWHWMQGKVDHVYLRHLSGEYPSILSADMSTASWPILTDTWPIHRPRLDWVSVDMFLELIDCRSTLPVGMSVDTRSSPRPLCCDRQSLVYRLSVSGVSVDCRWYRSFVLCFFLLK